MSRLWYSMVALNALGWAICAGVHAWQGWPVGLFLTTGLLVEPWWWALRRRGVAAVTHTVRQ